MKRGKWRTGDGNKGTSYVLPVKRENEKLLRNFIFCKNRKLQNPSNFGNTLPSKFFYKFAFESTSLSPRANLESQSHHRPVYPAKAGPPIILYSGSKVQLEAKHCPVGGV
jgi:hypothetical protein